MSVDKAPSKARQAYKFIEAHRDVQLTGSKLTGSEPLMSESGSGQVTLGRVGGFPRCG